MLILLICIFISLYIFLNNYSVPFTIRPTLETLYDALGCDMTLTIWDQLFRLAYTAAFKCRSKRLSEVSEVYFCFILICIFVNRKFFESILYYLL
jgi:hypothetical protein